MSDRDALVAVLCDLIQSAVPNAVQTVKWNAPNFSVAGRDLITLNLPPKGGVRVVFHRGAKAIDSKTGQRLIDDPSARLTWATDQRATAHFTSAQDVADSAVWLRDICQDWVKRA